MILGDGYLHTTKNPKSEYVGLKLEHSTAQVDYLKYKADILLSIFGGKTPSIYFRDRLDKRTNRTYKSCATYKSNSYLKILKGWIYKNGVKTYSNEVLNMLTPEGIALWYMDDGGKGSVYISKKTGKISSCVSYLCTDCSFEQATLLKEYFLSKWGIEFKLYNIRKDQYRLAANTANSKKLVSLVRPYIIPSMQYKISHVN